MRVLVTAFPAVGHFHAVAPFALAARAAGHEVCVATAPDLVPWAITCGLPSRPIGPMLRTLVASLGPAHPGRMLTDVWPGAVIDDLVRLCAEWQPAVVVHDEGEYAAVLAAARLGLPCVTHSWATPARSPFERAEAVSRLTPLWREHGGPAADEEPRTTGGMYLDACPPPFQLGGLRGIASVQPVRGVPVRRAGRPAAGVAGRSRATRCLRHPRRRPGVQLGRAAGPADPRGLAGRPVGRRHDRPQRCLGPRRAAGQRPRRAVHPSVADPAERGCRCLPRRFGRDARRADACTAASGRARPQPEPAGRRVGDGRHRHRPAAAPGRARHPLGAGSARTSCCPTSGSSWRPARCGPRSNAFPAPTKPSSKIQDVIDPEGNSAAGR